MRVVVVDDRLPTPHHDGGSIAIYNDISIFVNNGFDVTLIILPEKLIEEECAHKISSKLGIEIFICYNKQLIYDVLNNLDGHIWAVYFHKYINIMPFFTAAVADIYPSALKMCQIADIHFLREGRIEKLSNDKKYDRYVSYIMRDELSSLNTMDVVFSYSGYEVKILKSLLNGPKLITIFPWVAPVYPEPKPFRDRDGIYFIGNFKHAPNVDAIRHWNSIYEGTLQRGNMAAIPFLNVYGREIEEIDNSSNLASIKLHGYVQCLSGVHGKHKVSVIPLRAGAGVKAKVIDALAAGVPSVLSCISVEGIEIVDGKHYLSARNSEEWADNIQKLLINEEVWAEMSHQCYHHIKETYSFDRALSRFNEIYKMISAVR